MNPQKKLIRAETYSANFNSRHSRIIKSKSQPIQIDKLFQDKPQQTLSQSQQTEEEEETKIKKDEWVSHIFKNHPNILELRERITPITQKNKVRGKKNFFFYDYFYLFQISFFLKQGKRQAKNLENLKAKNGMF
ncbi:protein of unknown function duf761 [Anaeramoeba flamelloides]|uniref:Uncharacterized protein n=1 Tax=Anaeramoeba flamelloides TaxID=1746091 RepID=A0AAV7Z1Q0_9EUKA|nr:protein of unknown function duf761 [Anaeramoeba flamelloides]